MNKLFNMSAPPKSKITIEINQVSKYLVFDPNVLCELLNCAKDKLILTINEYIINNPNYLDDSPNSYLFALKKDKYEDLDYSICRNINLLLSVFSKTVNNIYIPNRQPIFTCEKFNSLLFFIESEILNERC